ncbi:MAG: NAD-dependent epimerase/dehydratase family protein [Acidimicrobiia bacterium]|nr:NAD-dependent epimerase/dehydratase family protein [Acidimicrobiia bacterium]
MNRRHVVFGASGGIGSAVIRELARQGREVVGVNRSGNAILPEGIRVEVADAARLDDVRRVMEGATVVYQCLFPAVQDNIIEVAAETGAKLVVANNLYMYDPKQGPMSEKSAHSYSGREGGKFYAEMSEQALTAHRNGKLRATVGQASDIYGPNVRHGIGSDQVFGPIMAGKPANFLGDLDMAHTYTYADDCGKALVTLADREEALGETWHLPNAAPIATRDLLGMVFTELGTEPRIRVANGLLLSTLALFNSDMRRLKREKVYQFTTPWLVDHSKYEREFGADVTPHADAVKTTVAWFREHPPG